MPERLDAVQRRTEMANKKFDDGGPANARLPYIGKDALDIMVDDSFTAGHPGMSLWDYYAGQAMAGIIAHPEGPGGIVGECTYQAAAYADQMIREKREREA